MINADNICFVFSKKNKILLNHKNQCHQRSITKKYYGDF